MPPAFFATLYLALYAAPLLIIVFSFSRFSPFRYLSFSLRVSPLMPRLQIETFIFAFAWFSPGHALEPLTPLFDAAEGQLIRQPLLQPPGHFRFSCPDCCTTP